MLRAIPLAHAQRRLDRVAAEPEVIVGDGTRLQQGLAAIGGARDPRSTGKFLSWIAADVEKESLAEREAAGLTWAQVDKPVQVRARSWFLGK